MILANEFPTLVVNDEQPKKGHCTVHLLAEDVKKGKCKVSLEKTSTSVKVICVCPKETYEFCVKKLPGTILAARTTIKVSNGKIKLSMKKAVEESWAAHVIENLDCA